MFNDLMLCIFCLGPGRLICPVKTCPPVCLCSCLTERRSSWPSPWRISARRRWTRWSWRLKPSARKVHATQSKRRAALYWAVNAAAFLIRRTSCNGTEVQRLHWLLRVRNRVCALAWSLEPIWDFPMTSLFWCALFEYRHLLLRTSVSASLRMENKTALCS